MTKLQTTQEESKNLKAENIHHTTTEKIITEIQERAAMTEQMIIMKDTKNSMERTEKTVKERTVKIAGSQEVTVMITNQEKQLV